MEKRRHVELYFDDYFCATSYEDLIRTKEFEDHRRSHYFVFFLVFVEKFIVSSLIFRKLFIYQYYSTSEFDRKKQEDLMNCLQTTIHKDKEWRNKFMEPRLREVLFYVSVQTNLLELVENVQQT